MNIKQLKTRLVEIESQIKEIAGHNIENANTRKLSIGYKSRIRRLLESRRQILNDMFLPTDENMRRFRAINNRLYTLTQQLHERFRVLETKMPTVMDCPDFDDDFEIEGALCYVFNDEDSVLKLEDDEYFGSDFTLMIKLIAELYNDTANEIIEGVYTLSTPLDDGESWNEYPFRDKPEFDKIIICHAVHQLTNHQHYSIPDLLRLNDFWAEVHLTIQSITAQDGTRYKPTDN